MANSDLVQSLSRGCDILSAVGSSSHGLSLAEIADHIGVGNTTSFNLAKTLVAKGFFVKTSNPVRYMLGAQLARLNPDSNSWVQAIIPLCEAEYRANPCLNGLSVSEIQNAQIKRRIKITPSHHQAEVSQAHSTPYTTATSVGTLAFMSTEQRKTYMEQFPFYEYGAGVWGEEENFIEELDRIAQQGYLELVQFGLYRYAKPFFNQRGNALGVVAMTLQADDKSPQHISIGKEVVETICCSIQEMTKYLAPHHLQVKEEADLERDP